LSFLYHHWSCGVILDLLREYIDKNLRRAYEVTPESMEDKLRSLLKDKLKQIDTPANKTKRTAIRYIRTAIPFSQETSGETHNIGKLVPGMANNAR